MGVKLVSTRQQATKLVKKLKKKGYTAFQRKSHIEGKYMVGYYYNDVNRYLDVRNMISKLTKRMSKLK